MTMTTKILPLSLLVAAPLFLAACPAPPIGGTDSATDTDTDTDTDTETTTSGTTTLPTTTTSPGTSTTTTGESESDSDTDPTTTTTTGDPDPVCGDGNVDADNGEECDDGNTEDGDGCTADCKNNVCGDGILHQGVEVCDDGVNDGSYGGCNADCASEGPKCGDGELQADQGEICDTDDEFAGCLSDCTQATSCNTIKTDNDAAATGVYTISPEGFGELLPVYCDMDADGGGYTFLKVSQNKGQNAADAEAVCAGYGMTLLVPRSPEHIAGAWAAATTENIAPVGNGGSATGPEYLSILGIYPVTPGESCVDMALNSNDCPEWAANDEQAYFVGSEPVPGQPGTDNCSGCSMLYNWVDGALDGYTAFALKGGGASQEYFCHIGDKLP
jgi:cysteine-rich repeat protein